MSKFKEFYKSQKDRIFAYLMKSTGDYYLANDIMQESFTRYLKRYGEGQTNPSLLNVITRNALIDDHRKPDRRSITFDDQKYSAIDPENHLMARETCRRVITAMKQLEKMERDILTLVVSSGLSYRGIARMTRTSEDNVKIIVHRARRKLKKIMDSGEV